MNFFPVAPQGVGLRYIAPSELALFAQWEKAERPYPWASKHFQETVDSDVFRTLVLESEGEVVGFASIQIVGDESHLLNIMTFSSQRRRGYAETLLRKVMMWAQQNGAREMVLDVDPENKAAVGLYEKIGFEKLETRHASYPRGEDAVLMRRKL